MKKISLNLLSTILITTSVNLYAALPDFIELAKKISPAVVNIEVTKNKDIKSAQADNGKQVPDIFKHFFGPQIPHYQQPDPKSFGSGFVVDNKGYIVTNHHVIEEAKTIVVKFQDRRELEAKVIGSDKRSDIALLKVSAKGLPYLKFGNSDNLEVGQWVAAIGSPFGFDYSLTKGVVSATGRSLPRDNYVPFIQTDVPINPGNSGGPLLNLNGKVIGVNAQIYTRSGGFMGVSFAIPSEVVTNVVKQLRESGKVTRGWLGVSIQNVNKDIADSFGLDKPHGALIAEVIADSAAQKAGLKNGDIITEFDGNEILFSSDLPAVVGSSIPGKKYEMKIVRNKKVKTIEVVLASLEEQQLLSADKSDPIHNKLFAAKVRNLTPNERKELKITTKEGIVITAVQQGLAAEIGLNRGDVITELNNQSVTTVSVFNKITASLKSGSTVSMRVISNGRPRFLAFKMPK